MHSTFFNNTEGDRSGLRLQSFPDPYLQGYHKGYNGAVAHHSFNIPFLQGRDATYKLSYTFDHRGPLDLVFQGLTFPQPNLVHVIQDEYWGIASLTVKTD